MSLLFAASFALLGTLAIAAMIASWKRFIPRLVELAEEVRRPVAADEIRLTVRETTIAPARRHRRLLRHMHGPRPVNHRLRGRVRHRTLC
jgi:hypothetical protein